MSTRLLNVALFGASLLFAIVVAEVALRIVLRPSLSAPQFAADSALVYRMRSNVRGERVHSRVLDYTWTTNSVGFRGTREYAPNAAAPRRIVALGDSFTFGIGVNDSEPYPALLETRLRQDCNPQVEVLNAGVGGYNTSQQLETYERFGRQFKPKLVIVGMVTNDFDDLAQHPLHVLHGDSAVPMPLAQRPKNTAAKRLSERMPGYRWLVTHSAIVDGVRQLYYGLQWRNSPIRGLGQRVELAPDPRLVALERAVLRRFQQQVTADSAKLMFVLMPDEASARYYVAGHPDSASVMKVMRGLCEELSLTCVDVGEWMVKNMPGVDVRSLYIQGNGHMNAAGMQAVADALEPGVRQSMGCRVRERLTDTSRQNVRRIVS